MIYLITKGQYDEFRNIGYVKTEKEAKKMVKDRNKDIQYIEDKYGYEECEKL